MEGENSIEVEQARENTWCIHAAARKGRTSKVKTLLRDVTYRNEINDKDQYGFTPLHYACIIGDAELTSLLLNIGCNTDITTSYERTVLYIASELGHADVVRLLLDHGCDLTTKTELAALHVSSYHGHTDVITELVKARSDVNCLAKYNWTALHHASQNNHLSAVDLLLASGSDVNAVTDTGATALILGSAKGHVAVVQKLINYGSNLNATDISGFTAIHRASLNGHADVIAELAKAGCDMNCADNNDCTALHRASRNNFPDVVDLLLASGSDVNAVTYHGHCQTALHIAAERGHLKVVQKLLKAGADINTKDIFGFTAFHCCAWFGHLEVAAELIQNKYAANSTTKSCKTALHLCAEKNHLNIVRFLLVQSINKNARNEDGLTALCIAAANGRDQIVDTLVRVGCDVNVTDRHKRTALHYASENGHASVVLLLIGRVSCIDAADENGDTALHLAAEHRKYESVKILLRSGCDVNLLNNDQQTALYTLVHGSFTTSDVVAETVEVVLKTAKPPCNRETREAVYQLAVRMRVVSVVEKFIATGQQVSEHDLQTAVKYRLQDMLKLFISSGAVIHNNKCDGLTMLSWAAQRGYSDIVHLLMPQCDVTVTDDDGRSALHHASAGGHCNVIETLLGSQQLIDANILDNNGNTPLMNAAISGHFEALNCLLAHGCDVNTQNKKGYSALSCAVENGCVVIVKRLIWNNTLQVDINLHTQDGSTPLMLAAKQGHTEIVDILLPKGPDVNMQNNHGYAALHYAAEGGHVEIVQRLLTNNECKLELKTNDRKTALHLAAFEGHSETVQWFLSHKAHSGLISHSNLAEVVKIAFETLRMTDARYKSNVRTVLNKLIVSDISTKIHDAFALAIEIAPFEVCSQLLQTRPNFVNSVFVDGETVLHYAVRTDSYKKCKLLLSKGFDMRKMWNKQTALEYALCHKADVKIVDLLLKHTESDDAVADACKSSMFVGESRTSFAQRIGSDVLQNWLRRNFCQIHFQAGKLLGKHSRKTTWKHKLFARYPQSFVSTLAFSFNRPQQKSERKRVVSTTLKFLWEVSTLLENEPATSHLAFIPRLTGSMAEGTKTFNPNELDFLCEIKKHNALETNLSVTHTTKNGLYIFKQHPQSGKKVVDPREVAQEFYQAVSDAIHVMIEKRVYCSHLILHKHALQLRDKISCLHLMWTGDVFKNMMIFVDLVPAFRLPPSLKPPKLPPVCSGNQPSHVIAKKSRHSFSDKKEDCLFSFSFSLHENEFVDNLPQNIRLGYTLAKALRIDEIGKPSDLSGLTLDEDEKINIEDVITTYMLKTCLMTLCEEHQEDDCKIRADEYTWTEMIYHKLHTCIHNRMLATYYGDGVLFQCGDHADDDRVDRVCCQKRLLILRVCDAILTWLNDIKCVLGDRLKSPPLLVYQRTKLE